ncbi:SIP domain-containing protein [Streptomyces roseicoloratus]|uniref:SIP domain-containing protein n=1 Tax=Streptomyces roseicoloratus TaxID=2508722 RepID=A0ABY9S3A8_9ACTN|nr:SIP domain-containing protein [Streptomyces roseicoloratus]WMX48413.1 SIP domain-containing protein [Streptomyces roseicoloratus]
MRSYTLRAHDRAAGTVDVDFPLHGGAGGAREGPATRGPGGPDRALAARVRRPSLVDAVRAATDLPKGEPYAWPAGEAGAVREPRRHLVEERGVGTAGRSTSPATGVTASPRTTPRRRRTWRRPGSGRRRGRRRPRGHQEPRGRRQREGVSRPSARLPRTLPSSSRRQASEPGRPGPVRADRRRTTPYRRTHRSHRGRRT